MRKIAAAGVLSAAVLSACSVAPRHENVAIMEGPPIVSNIVTPIDEALMCLSKTTDPETRQKFILGVGEISDLTGKEQITDGGNGAYVSQGLGDVLQTALVEAGAIVVNRRDMRVLVFDRERAGVPKGMVATTHHFTGSINRLDFIPGAAAELMVSGVGGGARQYRVMVGMNIAMTDTRTGQVVEVEALDKQVVGEEVRAGIGRFFGTTLVEFNLDSGDREPLQFISGQMAKLAGYNMLKRAWRNEGCDSYIAELYQPTKMRVPATQPEPTAESELGTKSVAELRGETR